MGKATLMVPLLVSNVPDTLVQDIGGDRLAVDSILNSAAVTGQSRRSLLPIDSAMSRGALGGSDPKSARV